MKFYLVCWRGIDTLCPCWIESAFVVGADDKMRNVEHMEVFLSLAEAELFLEQCVEIDGEPRRREFEIVEVELHG